MEYKIKGEAFQVVDITIHDDEKIYCEKGAMLYMSDGMNFETEVYGGVIRGLKRTFIKESFFMSIFSLKDGFSTGTVGFNGDTLGKIIPIDVSKAPIIAHKESFLCAESTVKLDVAFTKNVGAGLFGKEGFTFVHLSGTGMAFLKVSGDLIERDLKQGEKIYVNRGLIVGFTEGITYDVELIRRVKTLIFGGEGIFLSTLTGPGHVILQTFDNNRFTKSVKKTIAEERA